jgi:dUTP pyrophosphatase
MSTTLVQTNTIAVGIHRLSHAPEELPFYATPGAAGMDIRAALAEPVTLAPMQRRLIPTGFALEIPPGYEVQIRPRSGMSIKHGITLINCVGTIDSDYRDEVMVPVINLSTEAYTIQPGERIAQMLVAPVTRAEWQELETIERVEGRAGGFGSTGKH